MRIYLTAILKKPLEIAPNGGIALRVQKNLPHLVVHSMNLPSSPAEKNYDFTSDQTLDPLTNNFVTRIDSAEELFRQVIIAPTILEAGVDQTTPG
jgi:hypothetical protein